MLDDASDFAKGGLLGVKAFQLICADVIEENHFQRTPEKR